MIKMFSVLIMILGCSVPAFPQQQMPVSDQIAFSAIRIVVDIGNQKGFGTGFIFNMLQDSTKNVPVIVTNKHVIAGASRGYFVFTKANADGTPDMKTHIPITIDNFQSYWISHPDSSVDLAIMPIAPILTRAIQQGTTPFYRSFSASLIPTAAQLKELTAVEDILMVGYPIGIWDPVNNYPVFRKGITATHPALDYNGRQEFMIDAACYPGSSGSPVFILNQGSYPSRTGGIMVGNRFILLGILYAGLEYDAKGEVRIETIPHRQDVIALTKVSTNLGVIIRASRLLDFEPILRNLIGQSH